ncbi:MAG: GTP-binding protein [Roseiarcus sp.]
MKFAPAGGDLAVPLHVVTGFLGAGKTSLINRLLRARELADALVIVNEWGEVGLDHLLFEAIEGEVIVMPSGCLCCTLRGDLVDCLHELLVRRDDGALAPFPRIVLETSGLSDPTPILHALIADPVLSRRTTLAGVTTLVDAVNGEAPLDAHREARRQVALADRIALTKSDLVAGPDRAARLARLRAMLEAVNPVAPILDAAAGEFGLDAFLAEPLDFPARAGGADASVHAGSIRAYAFAAPDPVGAPAFARFQSLLHAMLGPRLLRIKGLVALAEHPDQPLVVNGAQHVFHAPRRLDVWPDGDRATRVVVIVDGVERAVVDRLWRALSGVPQIDAPDLAALVENPLAPRPGGLLG